MKAFLITMHVLAAFILVAVVLLQHGKGADIGATFGAGASQTVFGGRGASNFLSKMTTGAVIIFMLTSITLTYIGNPSTVGGLLDDGPVTAPGQPEVEQVPAGSPTEGQAAGAPAVEEIAPPATPAPAEPNAASATSAPAEGSAPAPAPAPEPETPKPGGR
jgi:preprotein translocase subunit SecG